MFPPPTEKYDSLINTDFPEMTELQDNHCDYSALQPVQPSCAPPEPYATFDEAKPTRQF